MTYDATSLYDRVTQAWTLLLGEDLHYGAFEQGDESLPVATQRLTDLMIESAQLAPGLEVLDVGCGTGSPACHLAARHDVKVTGITPSSVGVAAARARAKAVGVGESAVFAERDGMDNGFPDASFDRVWVLESSHLMRDRDRLIAECGRVLRPGGLMVLCDIVLVRTVPFAEVRLRRQEFSLLRRVFGDARMETMATYAELARSAGLTTEREADLTVATRPTFARWRDNATRHRSALIELMGESDLDEFVASCDVLEAFWDDGTLGYGLHASRRF
jgi:27-O-demethylrifamycin SV methyltransferase